MLSLEYLAGFIDGEGHLAIARIPRRGRSNEYCVRVAISNTNRGILRGIRRTAGGTLFSVGARKPAWKPEYALIWTNAAAAALLAKVAPHLRVKSKQAAAMLEFAEHLRMCRRARDHRGRLVPLSSRELEIREAFYRRLKVLNKRGPVAVPLGEEGTGRDATRNLSREYVAGFIDAEGSLMICKTRDPRYGWLQYRARASASNTDKAVLRNMQRAYGGILTYQPSRHVGWKPAYQLVWTDARVNRILSAVGPYLRLKREQADVLRQFLRHKKSTPRVRDPQDGRYCVPFPDKVLATRESLYRKLKALNAKGPSAVGGDRTSHSGVVHAEFAPVPTPAQT